MKSGHQAALVVAIQGIARSGMCAHVVRRCSALILFQEGGNRQLSIPSVLVRCRDTHSVLDRDHRDWHPGRERRYFLVDVWSSKFRWHSGFLVPLFLMRPCH